MVDLILITSAVLLGAIITASAILWRQRQKSGRILDHLSSLAREAARIPTYEEGLAALSAELASAQRYHQPLTIGVVALKPREPGPGRGSPLGASSTATTPVDGTPFELLFPIAGSLLQRSLRKSDRVLADTGQNEYVIALTHSRKGQAAQAIWRIQQLLKTRSGILSVAGISEFPLDGYTLEDLLKAARAARSHPPQVESASVPRATAAEETRSIA